MYTLTYNSTSIICLNFEKKHYADISKQTIHAKIFC